MRTIETVLERLEWQAKRHRANANYIGNVGYEEGRASAFELAVYLLNEITLPNITTNPNERRSTPR